jgi:chromosome segregation ATPase
MHDRHAHNRGELANAESNLRALEEKLEHIQSLLRERKAERSELESRPQSLAATGDINKLMALKSHSISLDKTIAELVASEAECARRIESARRYLYTLYVRLERLRQEAATLTREASKLDHSRKISGEELTSLRRVKLQIEAIAGTE